MARLIGNVDATGSLSTSVPGPATNASAVSLYVPYDSSLNDTSANGHIGTAVGNAAISSNQAKFGSYSAYFDGTGDAITYPRDTSFQLGADDFTIEAFVYRTSAPTHAVVAAQWTGSGNRRSFIFRFSGNVLWFYWSTNGSSSYSSQSFTDLSPSLNTWHHIAFVRSGSSGFCFLDGVKSSTTANLSTNTLYYPDAPLSIGALNTLSHSGGQNNFAGYIDDLRITKGFALYQKSFVPPSQAVGASLSGTNETNSGSSLTSLYLPLNSDVNDDSSNTHTITALGGAVISSAQSKFGGSSVYLDGGVNNANASRLRVSSDVYDQFRLSDFTIEMFIYPTTIKAARLWSQWEGTRPLLLQIQSNGNLQVLTNNTSRLVTSGGVTANSWFHIALVRIGETFTLYIDGVNKGRFEMTGNLNSYSDDAYIGARYNGAAGFEGYIDDFRIVRSGIYTGNFTPPTSALTASISQTRNDLAVLYLPFDNGLDDQARNYSVTADGDAAISATQAKFGGKSLALDGTGDRIEISHQGVINLGTADFTIEAWIYPTSTSSAADILGSRITESRCGFLFYRSGTNLSFYSSTTQGDGGSFDIASNKQFGTASVNTWTHLAATREGNTFRLFKDGALTTTFTSSLKLANSTAMGIGGRDGNSYFAGYVDDVRIIKGFARYTAAFTPPGAAHGTEVTGVTTDSRTFSSVWNLNSAVVTENFKAGTWPSLPLSTVTVQVFGAGGAGGAQNAGGDGGNGGIVKASKDILPGTVLKIVVGNGGVGWAQANTGLLQGNTSDAMRGGDIFSDVSNQTGGQGGSGSGVFVTSVAHGNAQVVAGGGGGGAGNASGAGGDSHSGTGASDSLNGSDGTGNSSYRGQGATTTSGGSANGNGSGAGAALLGGYSGTSSSTAGGGPYNSGGSGGGGYYGGSGAGHGDSASHNGGGGAGSGYVDSTWTRLSATGMTPKAGSSNASDNPADGADGAIIVTDGAGTTTYSTPGTYDHTVS